MPKKISLAMALGISLLSGNSTADTPSSNPVYDNKQIFYSHEGIYSFNADDLTPRWQALVGEKTFEPTMTENRLLVSSSNGVYAYDRQSGAPLWKFTTATSAFTPTVIDDTAFIAGEDGSLSALDVTTGIPRWTRQFPGWIYPPANLQGTLITGGSEGKVWGLSSRSGKLLWEHPLTQELIYRPISVGHNRVAVTTFDGNLTLIDQEGRTRWQRHFDITPVMPIANAEQLYLFELDGHLHALDLNSGKTLWQHDLQAKPIGPVTVIGNHLIAVTDNYTSHTLSVNNGQIESHQKFSAEPISSVFSQGDRALLFTQTLGIPSPYQLPSNNQ